MLRARSWRTLLATLFTLTAGCRSSDPAASPGPIVLVVVDTLRADHLSCYGYGRPTSPAMCALAEDGVLFERAYTTRTSTTPAIASMLTGLYPHRHGVKQLYELLPPAMTTLAERLHARGWATGGFVSSFVMVRDFSGFDPGFDVYDDDVRTREMLRDNYQRDAAETVEHAITWLRAHGPHAFLFVHLIEPHGPYTPPSPYLERFALPATGPLPGDVPAYQHVPGLRTVSEYVGRYDGEIATADAALDGLFGALRKLGWYAPATIVLVADHGESFGEEDNWFCHGASVNDAEAHVPLIVKFPAGADARPPGSRVSAPVSVIDVCPTVLHAANIAAEDQTAAAADLGSIARGTAHPAPPVTELEHGDAVTLAVHGDGCTVRWDVPIDGPADATALAADPTGWLALAHQLRVDPPDRDGSCVQNTASEVSALIADRLRFRLDIPVVFREEMRDLSNRARFIDARTQSAVPLAPRDVDALRQLGYAK
jgi:arylsulfatase